MVDKPTNVLSDKSQWSIIRAIPSSAQFSEKQAPATRYD
jgi:hypothetical protein